MSIERVLAKQKVLSSKQRSKIHLLNQSISWHIPQTLPSLGTQMIANRAHCHQLDERLGSQRTTHSDSSPSGTSCLAAFQADCYDSASAAFRNDHRRLQTVLLHGQTEDRHYGTGQSPHVVPRGLHSKALLIMLLSNTFKFKKSH